MEARLADVVTGKARVRLEIETGFGHAVGDQIEALVRRELQKTRWEVEVLKVSEFVTKALGELGYSSESHPSIQDMYERLREADWWSPLVVSKKSIEDFAENGSASDWQQAGADLVLLRGDLIFDAKSEVVLLNVKSHDTSRSSRPPNIMSAQRLLEFLASILRSGNAKTWLEKASLLFVGVEYDGSNKHIGEIFVKDLFKLSVTQIPQINFDAAIQIQWHVRDMKEIRQTKLEFIERLARRFDADWKAHAEQKTKLYRSLLDQIAGSLGHLREA